MIIDKKLKERFFSKVSNIGASDCWEWKAAKYPCGYGSFSILIDGKWRPRPAHRISWMLYHKREIPDGILVCHKCDNKLCVNPDHLFLGTHQDNTIDMTLKGKHWNQRKSHCKNGHKFSSENTILVKGINGLPTRRCRICKNERSSADYWKDRKPFELKTHCKNGHKYTEENTYHIKHDKWNVRKCRTCQLANMRKQHIKNSHR